MLEFGLFSLYPECLADGWGMLNIAGPIGETSRSLAHPSAFWRPTPPASLQTARRALCAAPGAPSGLQVCLPPAAPLSSPRFSSPPLLGPKPPTPSSVATLPSSPFSPSRLPPSGPFGASAPIWADVGSLAGAGVILGSECVLFLLTRSAESESTVSVGDSRGSSRSPGVAWAERGPE